MHKRKEETVHGKIRKRLKPDNTQRTISQFISKVPIIPSTLQPSMVVIQSGNITDASQPTTSPIVVLSKNNCPLFDNVFKYFGVERLTIGKFIPKRLINTTRRFLHRSLPQLRWKLKKNSRNNVSGGILWMEAEHAWYLTSFRLQSYFCKKLIRQGQARFEGLLFDAAVTKGTAVKSLSSLFQQNYHLNNPRYRSAFALVQATGYGKTRLGELHCETPSNFDSAVFGAIA